MKAEEEERLGIKRHRGLILFIILLAVLYLLPLSPLKPINALTNLPSPGYRIHISPWGYILAPFKGISLYFSLASDIKSQLISWLSWLLFLYILIRVIKFKQAKEKVTYAVESFSGILKIIFSFLLLLICVLFIPLPPQSLETKNSNEVLVDVHSHTTYSHDGLVTPGENIDYHLGHGFKAWFVTDHEGIKGAVETEEIGRAHV